MTLLGKSKYLIKKLLYKTIGPEVFSSTDSFEIDIIKKILKSGDTCIDVGANMGTYTKVMSDCVGETGKVFAFEPSPKTFKILSGNVGSLSNVVISSKAVGNKTGNVEFYITYQSGLSGLGDTGRGTVLHKETVPIIKLDDYLKVNNIQKVDFLKIDVEGFEGEVLKGAESLLRNQADLIVLTELDTRNLSANKFDRKEIFEWMRNLGYKCLAVERGSKQLIKVANIENSNSVNFVFSRDNLNLVF